VSLILLLSIKWYQNKHYLSTANAIRFRKQVFQKDSFLCNNIYVIAYNFQLKKHFYLDNLIIIMYIYKQYQKIYQEIDIAKNFREMPGLRERLDNNAATLPRLQYYN